MTRTKIVMPKNGKEDIMTTDTAIDKDLTACPECGDGIIDGMCKGCGWKPKIAKDGKVKKMVEGNQNVKSRILNHRITKSLGGEEKRLVTSIALKPEDRDAQGHIVGADPIEDGAHEFLARYNDGTQAGLEHKLFFNGQDLQVVESWIVPADMDLYDKSVKKGTWVVTMKVNDDVLWEAVKSGDVTGFSVGGRAKMVEE